jgi:uncharacterized LabA/DUF88 family protein
MENVSIFIDGSNLYHSLKTECGRTDLDFAKFVNWLVGDRKLVRVYYYTALAEHDPEVAKRQQRFLDSLSRIPYLEVRFGRIQINGGSLVEKGVDVAIAVDMVLMAVRHAYDAAILVSGDDDFSKAVNAVKDIGRHVEIASFSTAHRLRKHADQAIDLHKHALSDLWMS